jgi:L-lactate dehydrogenase complex protein LldG
MSMTARDQILTALRDALAHNRPSLEAMARAAPHEPPPFVHAPQPDLVDQFVTELEQLHARAYRCADEAAAYGEVGRILDNHGAKSVLAWDERFIGLGGFDDWLRSHGIERAGQGFSPAKRQEHLQALEPTPVGITGADVATAESGSVVLVGGTGRPRLASLLAPAHVVVIRASQLVRGLGDALGRLRELYGAAILDNSSSVTFITGPSRTADIELTLTLGVHGPREVHVVIIE